MNATLTYPAPAPPASAPPLTPDVMLAKLLALRDRVSAISKTHKAELEPYNKVIGLLEAAMLDALNKSGAKSIRTEDGTFYKTTRTSAKVTDWTQTLAFIRENEAWDLLEARISKVAVDNIINDTQAGIPGVTVSREDVLNARRS